MRSFAQLLRCPFCYAPSLSLQGIQLQCRECCTTYPLSRTRPVLLRPDNTAFTIDSYNNSESDIASGNRLVRQVVPSPSVNLARVRILRQLRTLIARLPAATVLVVGSGSQRTSLDAVIYSGPHIDIVHSDVDVNADVDLFCDAHELPFISEVFDAVITTAVLEHVMYPERAAQEIQRVLKPTGLIYSELPFMQQVHEGAYDFTRYTLSGHRRLFNHFEEIESGMVAGPATVLVWSIENLALAFVRGRRARQVAKLIVRLVCGWFKHVDRVLVARPEAMDGASCTFFFGRKREGAIADSEIIRRYVGAKHVTHA